MAPWLVTEAILSDNPIPVFNNGNIYRDFTYIDVIVNGVEQVMHQVPSGGNLHRVLNIGRGSAVPLTDFIGAIESALGKKATTFLQICSLGACLGLLRLRKSCTPSRVVAQV